MIDYYRVLGVPEDAGEEAIDKAFRLLAHQYHPDRGEGSSAQKFREAREAHDVLADPQRRRAYDLERAREMRARLRPEPMISPGGRAAYQVRPEPLTVRFPASHPAAFFFSTSPADDPFEELWSLLEEQDRLFRSLFGRW